MNKPELEALLGHADAMENATVRIERMIWLPSAMSNYDAPGSDFREFCEDLPDSKNAPLYSSLPCLAKFADADDWPEVEEVTEALFFGKARTGFIFQAAHPVMQWSSETSASFSWGYHNTAWLYAETLDGVVEAATKWASGIDAKEKAKQLSALISTSEASNDQ